MPEPQVTGFPEKIGTAQIGFGDMLSRVVAISYRQE
jgi:hypothetical protein